MVSTCINPTNCLMALVLYVSVKEKKFGDKCNSNEDCHFNGSYCAMDRSNTKSTCQCLPEFEVTNHIDKCGHGKYLCYILCITLLLSICPSFLLLFIYYLLRFTQKLLTPTCPPSYSPVIVF